MRSIERIFFRSCVVVVAQTLPQTVRCRRSSGNALYRRSSGNALYRRSSGNALSSQIRGSALSFCSDRAIGLQLENLGVLFVKSKKMSDNVFWFVCNKKGLGVNGVDQSVGC